jgi:hypothetical protein
MKARNQIRVTADDALKVGCPDCGAAAGDMCSDGWGAKAPIHAGRWLEVDKWNRLSQTAMSFEPERGLFA